MLVKATPLPTQSLGDSLAAIGVLVVVLELSDFALIAECFISLTLSAPLLHPVRGFLAPPSHQQP